MKAALHRRYGTPDVVTVEEVPTPVPRDDEILVRVHAATVGIVDSLARRGTPFYARVHFGLLRPRFPVLGCDFAGQVEAAGPAPSICPAKSEPSTANRGRLRPKWDRA